MIVYDDCKHFIVEIFDYYFNGGCFIGSFVVDL